MRLVHVAFALVASTSTAAAEEEQNVAVGFAVNSPLSWPEASSIGFSGYIAFADHHAIRLNVAHYKYNAFGSVISALVQADDEASTSGGTTDVGASYQYYPRSLFDGFFLEGGLMTREIDTRYADDNASPAIRENKSDGVAARALIGWSWLWSDRLFLATAIGASAGRYTGTERSAMTTYEPEYMTNDYVRYEATFEGYVRIGVALGL
jgi:hypothetical protein